MKHFPTFAAVLLVALLSAGAAAADPITALITAINAFAATSAVAAFVVRMGMSLVFSALATALAGKPSQRQPGIKTEHSTTGGVNPQTFILGTYATAGNMAAPPYSHPNSGKYPNIYLTYVIDIADMPGVSFSRLMVSGEYVEDLQASSDPQRDYEGEMEGVHPHLWLTWHDGSQTAADPYMLEHYATHSERPWSNDMIGTGLTYAVLTFKYNRERWNQLPGVRFEVGGIALYDPRADGSVGGSGAQRWGDPATWAQTDNPAVMIYNILRGLTLPDGRRWGGRVAAVDLPLDNWFAAMNECDLPVTLEAGGAEPQYRAGLEVSVDTEPAAVIEELMKACSASISEVGGVYKLRVGPPSLPVFFMSDDDVVVDRPQSLAPYPGLDGVHNAIHATHPSPAALWESRDAPPRYNAEWEAEDGGRQLVAQVDLPAVASDTQVQRLMRAWIEDERRFRRHSLTLPPEAAVLEPLDAIAWTSAREGYTAKVFEIGEATDDLATCLQTLAMRERDAGDFAWVPENEIPVTHPSPRPTRPAAREISLLNLEAIALADSTAAGRRPGLLLIWDALLVAAHEGVEYQIQLASGAAVTSGIVADATEGQVVISAGLLPKTAYRGRARILGARPGKWSDWAHATTDDLRFDVSDLGDDVRAALENANAVRGDHDALVAGFAGGDLATAFAEVETDLNLREIAEVELGQSLADVRENVLWTLEKFSTTQSTLSDAGVYVDPADGTVKIAAVEYQENRISETEIRLDAAEANINLRATQTYVDNAITQAVLDPSQVPVIGNLEVRLNTVEVDLDAAEAAISLKAEQTAVNGMGVRLSDAELEIDGLNTAISLAVTRSEFTPLATRVNNAEVALDLLDGASISQTVSDVRHLADGADLAGVNSLADLLEAYEGREAVRRDLAYATQDLHARVTDEREAQAAQSLALGVAIDGAVALIESEKRVRASETEANAQDITVLNSRIDGAQAGVGANASALSGLTTRVSSAEGQISSQAAQITDLSAEIDGVADDVATRASASALSGLTARVSSAEGAISSQSGKITSLENEIDGVADDVATRASANALNSLTTRVSSAEGKVSSQATQISGLTSTVGQHSTNITQTSQVVDGIRAEYTLKIDNNGKIGGVVARSQLNNSGAPVLQMGFIADQFAITAPSGGEDATPFVVHTTGQHIGGVYVPPGVYLKDAQIRNAGITSAKIADAAIGRAKVADVIESDNYAQAGNGEPTEGLRLNFRTGEVKTANIVMSRPMVLASGSFQPGGTARNGDEYLFINTGIRIGKDDAWRASNVGLVASAALRSGGTADGGITGRDEFWGCEAAVLTGARWNGYGPGTGQPQIDYRRDPAVIVDPDWATGGDHRVFLRIKVFTDDVWFPNPNIAWKVFQVT